MLSSGRKWNWFYIETATHQYTTWAENLTAYVHCLEEAESVGCDQYQNHISCKFKTMYLIQCIRFYPQVRFQKILVIHMNYYAQMKYKIRKLKQRSSKTKESICTYL